MRSVIGDHDGVAARKVGGTGGHSNDTRRGTKPRWVFHADIDRQQLHFIVNDGGQGRPPRRHREVGDRCRRYVADDQSHLRAGSRRTVIALLDVLYGGQRTEDAAIVATTAGLDLTFEPR
ncbi:MAG: hypothetical protein WCB92_14925 [Mycobacterium sp.]